MSNSQWICCQLGAREHYAIPRVLQQQNRLNRLVTDAWVESQSWFNRLPKSCLPALRERFHLELANAKVSSFNNSLINFELIQKAKKSSGWQKTIDRNLWFQNRTIAALVKQNIKPDQQVNLFAYSYAALDIFKYAKSRGWNTILGQIDPGLLEEEYIVQERNRYPHLRSLWQPAPPQYWQNWQEECFLAERIMVNSHWSKQALEKKGVAPEKIKIIPLAYNSPAKDSNFIRHYPHEFSQARPLRVLFLGQVILRKGIAAILEAIELLKNEPVEFWFVGSVGITFPETIIENKQVKIFGKVSRSTTTKYYQQADIFLFPTHSDGFGLTQLEAQAWRLPIITS
ncbi:MAG: glycosyltransferase family 4 protein [Pleurocapsa sp.]